MVCKLLLRNPRAALQLTLEFDEISGGAYGHTICQDFSAK